MKNALVAVQTKTMLSTEIAALCNKRHDHVMRDITVIVEQLKDSPNLGSVFKSSTYLAGNGKQEKCYSLDHEATMVVVTGYDVIARTKVIRRWVELETQLVRPLTQLEILSQSIGILTEHDKRLTATETKIDQLQVDLRNGVPQGYVSKANALRMFRTYIRYRFSSPPTLL